MNMASLSELARNMPPVRLELYYPGGDGEKFWNTVRNGGEYAADVAEIRSEGERLLAVRSEELTYSLFSLYFRQGSRLEYERAYFEKRRRLNTFGILSLLEPDCGRYEETLMDAVWSICSEVTWCLPAHVGDGESVKTAIDLFSAETGFTLAELRLLLGDRLPPMLRAVIAELVDERLFKPYLENGPYSWEEAEHNWSAVCAGSIGSAALLLLDEEKHHERLARILEKTQRSMGFYLRGFGDDGACLEGLGYWNYGFGYFVYYADLLLERSGSAKYEKFAYSSAFGFSVPRAEWGLGQAAMDSMLGLSERDNLFRVRRKNEETWIRGHVLYARWLPWSNVEVETWIAAGLPWHVRVHRITTGRSLDAAEGGFALALQEEQSISANGADISAVNATGRSGIHGLMGYTEGLMVYPNANTNLLHPRTVLPTLKAVLEPGTHVLAAAIYGQPGSGTGPELAEALKGLGVTVERDGLAMKLEDGHILRIMTDRP